MQLYDSSQTNISYSYDAQCTLPRLDIHCKIKQPKPIKPQ